MEKFISDFSKTLGLILDWYAMFYGMMWSIKVGKILIVAWVLGAVAAYCYVEFVIGKFIIGLFR
jgi:hypothetical protein